MRLLFQHHPCPKSMGTEVRGGVPLGRVADVLSIVPHPSALCTPATRWGSFGGPLWEAPPILWNSGSMRSDKLTQRNRKAWDSFRRGCYGLNCLPRFVCWSSSPPCECVGDMAGKEAIKGKLGGKRRLLRVLWTARRSNKSILKEISPEYSLEGLMLKLKLQYFGHLMRKTDSWEKTLMLGRILKAEGEKANRRWDGWMASPIQWTWTWANSRRR